MSNSKSLSQNKHTSACSEDHFPGKLHDMMSFVERENLDFIISWIRNGRAFMVHDPEKVVDILPMFFGQTKYRSFQRQLNMWSFERILDGAERGAFWHPLFMKGQKDLCRNMSRQTFKLSSPSLMDMPSKKRLLGENSNCLVDSMKAASCGSNASQLFPEKAQETDSIFASSCIHPKAMLSPIVPLPRDMSGERTRLKRPEAFKTNDMKADVAFSDGDPVEFEGKSFYYLDLAKAIDHCKMKNTDPICSEPMSFVTRRDENPLQPTVSSFVASTSAVTSTVLSAASASAEPNYNKEEEACVENFRLALMEERRKAFSEFLGSSQFEWQKGNDD